MILFVVMHLTQLIKGLVIRQWELKQMFYSHEDTAGVEVVTDTKELKQKSYSFETVSSHLKLDITAMLSL